MGVKISQIRLKKGKEATLFYHLLPVYAKKYIFSFITLYFILPFWPFRDKT